MKAALLIALLACAAVALAAGRDLVAEMQFRQFMRQFNKSYKDAQEYQTRLAYFSANLRALQGQRAQMQRLGQTSWNVGVTQFFDLSPAEFAMWTGGPRKYSAQALAISCLAHGVTAAQLSAEALPTSFDWRTKGVVNPIKNQGQCGSCWAFSTVGVIESAWAIKGNKLTSFSEQEIVDCSHGCSNEPPYGSVCNQGCNGGWQWNAFSDVMTWKGLETEAQYPYTAVTGTCHQKKNTMVGVISNYTCLTTPQGAVANEDQMAAYLILHGPIAIAMDAGILESYTSGIIDPTTDECSQDQLDHALVIVGFGTDATAGPFWIVRNSWGESWGEQGYFRIVRGKNACGLASAVSSPIL